MHEGCEELRLIVCRKRVKNNVEGTSVVAACGLFVKEVIAAVPITKQFELFRPKNAGAGGMVQVAMNFKTPEDGTPAKGGRPGLSQHKLDSATFKRGADFTPVDGKVRLSPSCRPCPSSGSLLTPLPLYSQPQRGGPLRKLLLLGVLAGGAFAAFKKIQESQN